MSSAAAGASYLDISRARPPVIPLHIPPHSIDAEQSVLGGLLIDSRAWSKVSDILGEADFYREDHRRIYRQIKALSAAGSTVDAVVVSENLKRAGEDTGGLSYLASLVAITPSAANVRAYAEIVREHSQRRAIIALGMEMQSRAEAHGVKLGTILKEFEGKFHKLGKGNFREWSVEMLRGSEITPEPISWIWDGFLARGKVHILAGAPGTGKTTIELSVAATITKGGRWPDGTRAAPGSVAIWSGEDTAKDVLVPRLMLAGADMSKVYIVNSVRHENGEKKHFDPATDLDLLTTELAKIPDLAFLIVDPVVSAVAGDSHKNSEVRRALQPLVDIAETTNCAVSGISHFSKGSAGRDPVERICGSVAFGALPRIVMVTAKRSDEQGGGRILVRGKSNIGPDGGGFAYDFEQKALPQNGKIIASSVLWGMLLEGTARDLLATAEVVEESGDKAASREASELLAELLADGPVKASEATRKLEQSGYSSKQIRTARERAGVKPKREGFGHGSYIVWHLPGAADPAHTCPEPAYMPIDAQQKDVASTASMGASMPPAAGEEVL